MIAYVDYGAQDYEEAVEYFIKVLEEEVLPVREEAKVRFNIAQLHAAMQQWPEVISWLNRWLLYTEDPNPLGFYLMGIAYYQLQDFDAAITYTKKALDSSPEPREAWLRPLPWPSRSGVCARASPSPSTAWRRCASWTTMAFPVFRTDAKIRSRREKKI